MTKSCGIAEPPKAQQAELAKTNRGIVFTSGSCTLPFDDVKAVLSPHPLRMPTWRHLPRLDADQ